MASIADHTDDQVAERILHATREHVEARLEHLRRAGVATDLSAADVDRVATSAADHAAAALTLATAGTSVVALRIGPIHTVDDLARYLPPPGGAPLTGEAVRKRAKLRQLVAFLTDDRQWAFPAWQFEQIGGHLVPNEDILDVWRRLPAGGFLTGADLAAWMVTRMASLGDATPVAVARARGSADEALQHAISRLHARAA